MAEVMRRMKINELPSQAEEIDEAGLIVYTEDGSKVYCAKMTDFVAKVKELYSDNNEESWSINNTEEGAETEYWKESKNDITQQVKIYDNNSSHSQGSYNGARLTGIYYCHTKEKIDQYSKWYHPGLPSECYADTPEPYKYFYEHPKITNEGLDNSPYYQNMRQATLFNDLYATSGQFDTWDKVEQMNQIVETKLSINATEGKLVKLRDIFPTVSEEDKAGDLLVGYYSDYVLASNIILVEMKQGGLYEDVIRRYPGHRVFALPLQNIPADRNNLYYSAQFYFTILIPNMYYGTSLSGNIQDIVPVFMKHYIHPDYGVYTKYEDIEHGLNSTVVHVRIESEYIEQQHRWVYNTFVYDELYGWVQSHYQVNNDIITAATQNHTKKTLRELCEHFQRPDYDGVDSGSAFHDGPRWDTENGNDKGPIYHRFYGNFNYSDDNFGSTCGFISDDVIITEDPREFDAHALELGGGFQFIQKENVGDDDDEFWVYINGGNPPACANYIGLTGTVVDGELNANITSSAIPRYTDDQFGKLLDLFYPESYYSNIKIGIGSHINGVEIEDLLHLAMLDLNSEYFYHNNARRRQWLPDKYDSACDSIFVGGFSYGDYIINRIINKGISDFGRRFISSFYLNEHDAVDRTTFIQQSIVYLRILRANGLATFTDHGVYGFGLTQELYSQLQPALEFGDGIEYDEETGEVTAEGSCRDILVNGRTVVNPLDKTARINLANVNLIQECQIQPGTNYEGHTVVAREMVEEFDTDQIRHTYYSYTIGLSSDIIPSEQAYNPSQVNTGPYEYGPYTVGSTQSLPSNESYVVIFDTVIVSPVDSVFCLFLKDNSHQSGYPFDPSNQYYDSDYVDFDIQSVKANVPTKFRIVKVVPATNASPVTFASYQASIMNTLPYSAWPLPSNIYAYGNTTVKKLINV